MKALQRLRVKRLERLARLTKTPLGVTPGVELRIMADGHLLLDVDSDHLYWLTIWGGFRQDHEGWSEIAEMYPAPVSPAFREHFPIHQGAVQLYIRPRPRRP